MTLKPLAADTVKLRQMAVDPAWQGRGHGRRLVRAVEAVLRERGITQVTLSARRTAEGFYGALGYSNVTLKVSSDTDSTQPDDNGLSYGVGFEAYGFNVEWMQYLDTTDIDASAVAIGYNYHF